ncbi:alpha-1,2-mannosyltransferase ALG9-like [Liolophura sinensis]|uniref:alpha-1,2-mannosyltransferase ALG9-like n=1 Tax=Liolophura sinensis TaxID=3198878 RepID=UPI003158D9C9
MSADEHVKKRGGSKPTSAIEDTKSSRSDTRRDSYYQPWTPSAYTAFKTFLSARLCAAVWSIITDCDETFNYWEPLHYVVFGSGLQTWEYSPVYAIRSYTYLVLHAIPVYIYNFIFQSNKIVLFYVLRCVLAICCALSEVYFYKGVCKQFGANTGRIMLCFLLFSTGMFIASSAFLPSSFSMYLTMVAMGAWFLGNNQVAILGIAASAILGWPFAGILGAPIAWDIVVRKKKVIFFIKWCVAGAVGILVPMGHIDHHFYGKIVIAPLNIILYNVFSEHGADLYGVAPMSFYFINGFLNYNIAFILALVSLPLTFCVGRLVKTSTRSSQLPLWLSLLPMYIWILIFFTRSHKEERFLFPIYPFFALAAALCVDYVQKLYTFLTPRTAYSHYTEKSNWIAIATGIIFAVLSVSRSVALYQGYHAPQDIFLELTKVMSDPHIHTMPADRPVNVCIGKEWYRYPSSFFLPAKHWHLRFIQSEFKGQLPKPYGEEPDATSRIPENMNDMNLEEPSRYTNISKCHYLVDLDLPEESVLQPRFSQEKDKWKILASYPFLDNSRSNRFFRAFFIPFVSAKYCSYVDYNLLRTKRTKRASKANSAQKSRSTAR